VRYRLMASYQGSPFEAGIGPSDGDIVLFAACPPPEELGFEPATGHWRKQLSLTDVQAVWESRPVGTFRGERCMVLDDLGDRLHIGYLGHDGFRAEQLGYWQVDRGVFELVAPRTDVADISEERTEYRRQVTAPHPVPAPQPATAPWPVTGPLTSAGPASGPQPVVAPPGARLADTADPEPATYQPSTGPEYAPRSDSGSASGQYRTHTGYGLPAAPAGTSESAEAYRPSAGLPMPDSSTGVALPLAAPAPLPLEAEAMRAASAARRTRPAAGSGGDAAPLLPTAPDRDGPATERMSDAGRVDVGRRAESVGWPREMPPAGVSAPGPAGAMTSVAHPAAAALAELSAITESSVAPRVTASPAAAQQVSSGLGAHHATASPATAAGASTGPSAHPATASPATAPHISSSPQVSTAPQAVSSTGPATPAAEATASPASPASAAARPRRAARRRLATERLFGDLASLAGIPADSYAVGEDVEGALCLVQTQHGFEVFHSAGGARHELQVFATEESACFYLFGVLAAEAVRNGSLARAPESLGTRQA
jgi:hypothetical protein